MHGQNHIKLVNLVSSTHLIRNTITEILIFCVTCKWLEFKLLFPGDETGWSFR